MNPNNATRGFVAHYLSDDVLMYSGIRKHEDDAE